MIATLHDLQNMLAAPATHDAALTHLQMLLDEEYGYDASGAWAVVGNGGLARLGLSRAEAVAMGAVEAPGGGGVPPGARSKCGYLIERTAQSHYTILPCFRVAGNVAAGRGGPVKPGSPSVGVAHHRECGF